MTQHIDEARKIADNFTVEALTHALAAAEERGRSEERERCAKEIIDIGGWTKDFGIQNTFDEGTSAAYEAVTAIDHATKEPTP